MPELRYLTADVFTSRPFTGNQLAIVFGADDLPTATLQDIAREFNYSETVFVFPPADPSHTRRVRIFTPGSELPFAGHPTIGTAHALVATGAVPVQGDEVTVVLGEGVGPVPVRVRIAHGVPVHAELTTAMLPEERSEVPSLEAIAESLSLEPSALVGGAHAPAGVSCGIPFLVVPLVSVDAVRRATVRTDAWERHLRGRWASEPLVFAMARGSGEDESALPTHVRGCDIRARVFVPGLAVPEDPATGSANACLAGYLAARTPRDGTVRWEVAQGIEMGRPSRLSIEADKANGAISAIRVGGASVLVSEGTLRW
jgi:trans-2,3-dihydro-3-hydroxyanthranilate isomerase